MEETNGEMTLRPSSAVLRYSRHPNENRWMRQPGGRNEVWTKGGRGGGKGGRGRGGGGGGGKGGAMSWKRKRDDTIDEVTAISPLKEEQKTVKTEMKEEILTKKPCNNELNGPKLKFSHNRTLLKGGQHKVWKREGTADKVIPNSSQMNDERQENRATKLMKKQGPNKLIIRRPKQVKSPKRQRQQPNVKRIRLTSTTSNSPTATDDQQPPSPKSDTLTNFAYKSTCKKPTRSLIRINPNDSTPICPSILKNKLCKNERCTKRHDVPRHAAMPLCSFFERNGMCLREECPYRHVKVDAEAELCQQFATRGFCDDVDCHLRHVRVKEMVTED